MHQWPPPVKKAQTQTITRSYLQTMPGEYFTKCPPLSLRYTLRNLDDGIKHYKITGGVPQGSVLGPLLWNLMCDNIFRLKTSKLSKIIFFAEDVAIVVVAKLL